MTSSTLFLPYLALFASVMRALAVKANLAPPTCRYCKRPRERRHADEPICRC